MICYATIVTTESYFPGVKLLKESLELTGTKIPLKIFVPERLYQAFVAQGYCSAEDIECYKFDVDISRYISKTNLISDNPQWNYTFDKLVLFSYTKYSKMVYLDCDMEIKENIDELFQRPHMAAVNPSVGNSDYTRGFNSGLMVIVPEDNLDRKILCLLNDKRVKSLESVSDNDLLQWYYDNWGADINQVRPDCYNIYGPYIKKYKNINNIKVLHYIGRKKPWM